jgi:hypothetical protein
MSYYGTGDGETPRAGFLFVWLVFTDAFLKLLARCANCVDPLHLDLSEFARIYNVAAPVCGATELFGTPFALHATPRAGVWMGLLPEFGSGLNGQLYGLGLLALAVVVAILVLRWQWRAHGDAMLVAVLGASAWMEAFPRLSGDGRGLATFEILGQGIALSDIFLPLALVWIAGRVIGEMRA